ncbi:MAG: response regulator transcription factor [Thermoanaerobaculia bacterium]|nr:response regulator transcription factor [Thermoanaerobaculia bacterium]
MTQNLPSLPTIRPGRHRILVVDDDRHIREVIRFALQKAGFRVAEAGDGRRALDICRTDAPDLVILDILMPEMDGTDVCRELRAAATTASVPIVFLTSKSDEIDRILGLELGGDDYVTKPFSPRELVARVKAVLRRVVGSVADQQTVIECGPLRLDPDRFEATWRGREIPLTVTEFGLLRTLMQRPGRVFTRDELMDGAYNDLTIVSDRTINSHVKRLRRKLAAHGGEPIETVHGVGYRLRADLSGD